MEQWKKVVSHILMREEGKLFDKYTLTTVLSNGRDLCQKNNAPCNQMFRNGLRTITKKRFLRSQFAHVSVGCAEKEVRSMEASTHN